MTKKKYIDHLKNLYPSCKFDQKRDDYHLYEKHKITYGEMEYEGMQQLYSYVKKVNSHIDTFIDVGSGRGKLCMFMAAQPEVKRVLGVELVTQRHNDALALKDELIAYQETGKTTSKRVQKHNCYGGAAVVDYANKVTFLNQNVLEIDLNGYIGGDAVFVWFSNLCFDQSTTNDIFEKLNRELPKGSIVCCSKEPVGSKEPLGSKEPVGSKEPLGSKEPVGSKEPLGSKEPVGSKEPLSTIGESLGQVIIPMSWSRNSTVFMYKTI
jgi:hypothetical protein